MKLSKEAKQSQLTAISQHLQGSRLCIYGERKLILVSLPLIVVISKDDLQISSVPTFANEGGKSIWFQIVTKDNISYCEGMIPKDLKVDPRVISKGSAVLVKDLSMGFE